MPIHDSVYDDDVAQRRRMWRHLRSAITLLALVTIIVAAALFSWRNVTDGAATTETSSGPTCAPSAPAAAPKPGKIKINVYNATDRDGLAGQVAKKLKSRGFKIVDVANDPLNRQVDATAEVRTSAKRQAMASVVMGHVAQSEFKADDRSSKTVDLVLGEGFDGLVKPAKATPFVSDSLAPCTP